MNNPLRQSLPLTMFLILLCWACQPSHLSAADEQQVIEIEVLTQSGQLLSQRQWQETFSITRSQVSLRRSGVSAESIVNAGSWIIPFEPAALQTLFVQIEAVDCAQLKRMEAQESPDGGQSRSYTLHYQNGSQCTLYYDPGTAYQDGERITAPIQRFIDELAIPPDAQMDYRIQP